MTHPREDSVRRAWRLGIAVALVSVGPLGCVLPVKVESPASPRIIGWYRGSDDVPVSDARLLVSDDAACRKPLAIDTTGPSGVFELPATTVTRRGIWLVPAFERFHNTYWLCASATGDTALQLAYEGVMLFRAVPPVVVDSLVCLEWSWQDSARVTCAGPNQKSVIQTVGTWTEGGATGFHRLIVVEPVWQQRYGGLYLQWVERPAAGGKDVVRETAALHVSPRVMTVDEATLRPGVGGSAPCATIRLIRHETSVWTWSTQREDGAVALGPPGEMRRVGSCAEGASPGPTIR